MTPDFAPSSEIVDLRRLRASNASQYRDRAAPSTRRRAQMQAAPSVAFGQKLGHEFAASSTCNCGLRAHRSRTSGASDFSRKTRALDQARQFVPNWSDEMPAQEKARNRLRMMVFRGSRLGVDEVAHGSYLVGARPQATGRIPLREPPFPNTNKLLTSASSLRHGGMSASCCAFVAAALGLATRRISLPRPRFFGLRCSRCVNGQEVFAECMLCLTTPIRQCRQL